MTVALVTGAGRGIGREVAVALAGAGHAVALLGRSASALAETAASSAPARALVVVADVTDPAGVRRAVAEVTAELGPVTLLVNNAGRIETVESTFADADLSELWEVVEANVRGPMLVTAAVLPGMLAAGCGRVVNMNSGFAWRRANAYTGYAVSKAALARFTALVDHQHGPAGIRAFDVSPGAVATDMTAGMAMFRGRTEWTPVRRVVEVVLMIAAGRLDPLAGRFVHAGLDDIDDLLASVDAIRAADARVLRLVPYAATDPLP